MRFYIQCDVNYSTDIDEQHCVAWPDRTDPGVRLTSRALAGQLLEKYASFYDWLMDWDIIDSDASNFFKNASLTLEDNDRIITKIKPSDWHGPDRKTQQDNQYLKYALEYHEQQAAKFREKLNA